MAGKYFPWTKILLAFDICGLRSADVGFTRIASQNNDKMSPVVRSISSDDNKEIDGFYKDSKKFLDKAFGDIAKSSSTKQLVFGTASGWFTGYVGMKVGKIAAVGLGSGIILLHLANQSGYININWDKIHNNVDNLSDKIEKETTKRSSALLDKVITFMKNNSYYSAGFAGGVFFGFASS